MPSKHHHDLLIKILNEYSMKGYTLLHLNRYLTKDYRPDAIVENDEEIVVIEAVITSDTSFNKERELQQLFSKPLRIDKRGKLKRLRLSHLQGLARSKSFSSKHEPDCYGKVVALYIYSMKKWLKIGDYCKKCGDVGLLPKYVKGFDKV